MPETKSAKAEGLMYKGHPLRRVDNLIYYGTMAEKYIIMMQVLDSKKEQDLNVATRVSVQRRFLSNSSARIRTQRLVTAWSKRAKKTVCTQPWMWPPSGWTAPWPARRNKFSRRLFPFTKDHERKRIP